MELIILILHLVVCVCLIGLVLLQRSEGGALGMGGGGGGSGALMSGRGAADALARMTSVAGGFFLVTSLGLTFLSGAGSSADASGVFEILPRQERSAPDLTVPPPADASDDPTQSSLPEEGASQLASVSAGPAEAAATPATAARAAPLDAASTPQQRPAVTSASSPAASRQTPATTQSQTQTARTPPAATPTQRPATPQQASTQQRQPAPAAQSQGAVSGITLTEEPSPESPQGVQAVRRDQRAGPDQ